MGMNKKSSNMNMDSEFCLAVRDFGKLGLSFMETDLSEATYPQVLANIINGEYENIVKVVMFNPGESTCRDLSEDAARDWLNTILSKIQTGEHEGRELPAFISDYVDDAEDRYEAALQEARHDAALERRHRFEVVSDYRASVL